MHDMEKFEFLVAPEAMEFAEEFEWFDAGVFTSEERSFLGVTSGHACGEEKSEGAKIGSVIDGSSAHDMGLQAGDIVTSFNGTSVNHFDELADLISASTPGDKINLEVTRDGKNKKIKGDIGKRTYSECDSFKVFKDFKGTDEGGNLFYDYEFNFDEAEMEDRLEDVYRKLEESRSELDEQREQLDRDREFFDSSEMLSIRIEVEPRPMLLTQTQSPN
jgi:hypothetical protein